MKLISLVGSLLIVLSSTLQAQSASISGDIRGTISDASGAVLPKVTITWYVVGGNWASLAVAETEAARGTSPYSGSSVPRRHCVCPSEWHTLGDVAQGAGLWFWHDLLEAPARLATVWYLATDSLFAAGLALPLQSDRLVPSRSG